MKDLTGQRFGMLIALEPTSKRVDGKIVWKCKCDCGNLHYTANPNLTSGDTTSCGCHHSKICSSIEKGGNGTSERAKCAKLKNILDGKLTKANVSGITGVCFDKSRNKWKAYIMVNRKLFNLGRFSKFEHAVKVRKAAEWMFEEQIENLEEELSKLKEGVSDSTREAF